MKIVRIQIDMLYQVPDDLAESIYNTDIGFFESIKESFNMWGTNKDPRIPVEFDIRHHMGTVIEDETDEKNT